MNIQSSQNRAKYRRDHADIIAALDIGGSKISCCIARALDPELMLGPYEIIGLGQHGIAAPQQEATNYQELERGVRSAIEAAERLAGLRLRHLHIGVQGRFLRSRRLGVDLEISRGIITRDDVADALHEGARFAQADGFTNIDLRPVSFLVDQVDGFDDPVGMQAAELSIEMVGVSARTSYLENLSALLAHIGVEHRDFYAAPMAAAEVTLVDDEKDLGVVLVDLGARSTSYAVYDRGEMVDCGGIGIGANNITRDIAQIFSTSPEHAERLKVLSGSALTTAADEHDFISFPLLGERGEVARARKADLNEVIAPRLQEIFELIAQRLNVDDLNHAALRRTVLSGGGSQLLGAREMAEKTLKMKARIGRPVVVDTAPELASAPQFASCIGMIHNAAQKPIQDSENMLLSQSIKSHYGSNGVVQKVQSWIRTNF